MTVVGVVKVVEYAVKVPDLGSWHDWADADLKRFLEAEIREAAEWVGRDDNPPQGFVFELTEGDLPLDLDPQAGLFI